MAHSNQEPGNSRARDEQDATERLVAEITAGLANRPQSKRRGKRRHPSMDSVPSPVEVEHVESEPRPVTVESTAEPAVVVETRSAPVVTPEISKPEPAEPAPVRLRIVEKPPFSAAPVSNSTVLAIFCCDEANGSIASYLTNYVGILAARGIAVHIFARKPIPISAPGVRVYPVGPETAGDLILSSREFSERASAAFDSVFPGEPTNVVLLGHEWMSIPTLTDISARHRLPSILSLHSLESQRSDMRSELSRAIQKIEADGLRAAHTTLVHDGAAGTHARNLVRECEGKLVFGRLPFISRPVDPDLDAGAVKARFQIGPIDPTILFVGELDERHGPDVLMKAVPAILKNHKQARFIFVGDGALQWPLRVHARYLLLEHAVRIAGHLSGDPLFDLIQSVDIVAVPSRSKTEDWPILAAWAAKRPVVATHSTAGTLLKHQVNSVLCYPVENSFVWGVEQLLFNEDLRKNVAEAGHQQLEELHGWNSVATQIESLMKSHSGVAHA